MIFSDRAIAKAIKNRQIIVEPPVHQNQYDSSSLNLRVGDDFRRWKSSLAAAGTSHHIDLNLVDISHLLDFTEELRPDSNGFIIIEPNDFIIV
jgi:deoxycytidine triphosphate deaminase